MKGRRYRVQFRAKNEVGYGPWSAIGHILAASVPQKPVFISATIVDNKIKIAWKMPYNSASLITKAEIRLAQSDGSTYVEDKTNCDGANNALFDAR